LWHTAGCAHHAGTLHGHWSPLWPLLRTHLGDLLTYLQPFQPLRELLLCSRLLLPSIALLTACHKNSLN
jgi:hypothetical protein